MSGPILIQGAMEIELEVFRDQLQGADEQRWGGYQFWMGTLGDTPAVLSLTGIGTIHCAAATALGAVQFAPSVMINQGIAGAHTEDLHVGDIVIGESAIHINDLTTPSKGRGDGSDPFAWDLYDHADKQEPHADPADPGWVRRLETALYHQGRKVVGRLGSGDLYSREYDRILWLRERAGHLCEDMESIAAYRVCAQLGIPCVGVRIISNNELTGETYQRTEALKLQKLILSAIR